MKKVFPLLIVLLMMLLSLFLQGQELEDSLVSDGFNNELLSLKWTQIYEGNPGTIYETHTTTDGYFVQFTATTGSQSFSKTGVQREFPEIIKNYFNEHYGRLNVTIKRCPTDGQGNYGCFRIDFNDGTFIETHLAYYKDDNDKFHYIRRHYDENGLIKEDVSGGFWPWIYTSLYIEKDSDGNYYVGIPDEMTLVGKKGNINNVSLFVYADNPPASTSMSGFECYPDLDDLLEVAYSPNRLYYEQDNVLHIQTTNYYDGSVFNQANVTILNHDYEHVYGPESVSNGMLDINLHPEEGDSIRYYMIVKNTQYDGQIDTFEIPILAYNFDVEYPTEIPVLTYNNFEIAVSRAYSDIQDAHVIVTNGIDVFEEGYTGTDGRVQFTVYTECTKDIEVIVDKDGGFRTFIGYCTPYMWSYSNEATGPNNANHIVRNDETGELFMTYTQHNPYPDPFVPTRINRVIGAYSDNDGEWWYVEDMGYGMNSSIDLDIDGNPEIFYDRVTGYYYNTFLLPNPSVVTNGSIWVAPGSMWHDSVNGLVNTAGIKYVDTEDKPYLVNAVFDVNDPLNADVEVVIDYNGRETEDGYLVMPHVNPSIALAYNSDSYQNDRLIAFEDKNSEICQIRYNSLIPRWDAPERKSFSDNLKSINPHMDAFYSNVSLVWQEESAPGTDNYRIYLNDSKFFGDNTETNKQFPKVKRNQYISCVDDNNYAKLWYFKDSYVREIDLAVSTENIYYPDFDIKTTAIPPIKTRHTAYFVFTEQDGDIYKINTGNTEFTTNDIIQPLDNIALSDTTDVTHISPIYNYIPSLSRPVDRITSTITGLDYTKYYELKVNTTNNNKNEPYILMVDGNITEVIYGKENELLVPVNAEYVSDREISVSVDMVKGNPNRTVDVEIYQYDEVEGEETAKMVQNNTLPFKTNETEGTAFYVTNKGISINGTFDMEIALPNDDIVKVSVYDIMGREVNGMDKALKQGYNTLSIPVKDKQNNTLSKGVYFIKIKTRDNTYTGKLVNIR